MVSLLPDANLDIILDSGHLSNIEQPEDFNKIMRKFIERYQDQACFSWTMIGEEYALRTLVAAHKLGPYNTQSFTLDLVQFWRQTRGQNKLL